jgi:anti-anti-sigma factor
VADATVLELHGEIDLAALPEVELHVDDVTRGPQPRVVIDLRPIDFMDCSGLRALVHARRRVDERDGDLQVVCERPLTLKVLRAAGLLEAFSPVPDLDSALAP